MYTTTPDETIEQIYEKFRSFSTKELEDHLDEARKHNSEIKYPSFKDTLWEGDLSLALSARIDEIDTTPHKTIEQLREKFTSFSSSKSHNQDDDTGNQHLSFSQTDEDITVSGDLGSFVMVYNS